MAKRMKQLTSYPALFFDIAEKAARGETYFQFPQPNGEIARANQKLFHKFRIALAENGHPHADAAIDLIVRVTNIARAGMLGKYYLEFTCRGLAILADEARGIRSPFREDGLPNFEEAQALPQETLDKFVQDATPQVVERKDLNDPFERMMEGMLERQGRAPIANGSESSKESTTRFVKEEEVKHSCPPHEWNSAGSACLHCGAPNAE